MGLMDDGEVTYRQRGQRWKGGGQGSSLLEVQRVGSKVFIYNFDKAKEED